MTRSDMSVRTSRRWRSLRKVALGVTGLVGFLAVWQLIPTLGIVKAEYLPYVTDVLARLYTELLDLAFWRKLGLTMTAWAIGLAIATVAAVILGTVVGLVPFLR